MSSPYASKVPEVTLGFWIIKILATTLGETAGDTVTMTWLKADIVVNSGYLIGSAIFLSALIVLVSIQIATKKFYPFLYWAVIVASTTAGTAMADFATRSLGIGYTGGSLLLFAALMRSLCGCQRTADLSASRSPLLLRDVAVPINTSCACTERDKQTMQSARSSRLSISTILPVYGLGGRYGPWSDWGIAR